MNKTALSFALCASIVAFIFGLYSVPHSATVVLTGQSTIRFDNDTDNGSFDVKSDVSKSRDVRLVSAKLHGSEQVRTYRNEDALLYAKFDSGTLDSEINSILYSQSKQSGDVVVRASAYGFRSELLSLYPNLIGLKRIEGASADIAPSGFDYGHALGVLLFTGMIAWAVYSVVALICRLVERAAQAAAVRAGKLREVAEDLAADAQGTVKKTGLTDIFKRTPKTPPETPRRVVPNVSSER